MSAFSRADYETLLYSLREQYPQVSTTTLRLYTNSATTAFVRGSVHFHNGLELRVFEYVDLTDGEILDYSYAILRRRKDPLVRSATAPRNCRACIHLPSPSARIARDQKQSLSRSWHHLPRAEPTHADCRLH